MRKFFSFVAAVLFAGSMMAGVAEIKFTEAAGADAIAEDATYTAEGTQFVLTLHDAGNKMVIDANNCRFGDAEGYTMYNFRIKSGGASSTEKNFFTLSIPEAGTLRIAARSASGSATDRKLTIEQGADSLYNAVVQDADSIVVPEGETNVKVFPYVEVAVAAGEVRVSYTAAMNFYGFALVTEDVVPAVPQYEVAEAIAAGLQTNDEVMVRGVITKMEFKGKNFAKYGSVNIYVADATGAEGEFEFYNCYSLEADTFRTSSPAYDATSTAWAQFDEVVDGNGNAIHVGDTVIAFGKYTYYQQASMHELNTGCYLVDVKPAVAEPIVIANLTYGMVFTEDFAEWGAVDILVTNQPIVGQQIVGDGYIVAFDILPENANDITGSYSALAENLDLEYSGITQIAGTDTTEIELADGVVSFQLGQYSIEAQAAQLALAAELEDVDGNIYHVSGACVVYYEFLPEEQGVENVAAEQKKAIKKIEMGNVVIEKNGVRYNVNGAVVR